MAPINIDESIHSFIIRRMLLYGALQKPQDLKGVVSLGGVVYGLQTLNKEQRGCIGDINTNQFADIIESNAPYLGADLESRTKISRLVLQNIADNSYRDPTSRTQLRYCIKCAKIQLRSLGYSYFKIEWLRSAECSVHKTRLHHVSQLWHHCCDHRANILENLTAALTGYCHKCQNANWEFSAEVIIDRQNRALYLFLRNDRSTS